MKQHNKPYNLGRNKGNEQASTQGKQLTIVVTSTTSNCVYYRLLSSSNPKEYHWFSSPKSPLQPNNFVIDQPYGVNTLVKDGKYVWCSTFPLLTYDLHHELTEINQDTMINLLDSNDFRHITDLHHALVNDFNYDELTPNQILFIEDVDDLNDYWRLNNDYRVHFLPQAVIPTSETEFNTQQFIDNSGLFVHGTSNNDGSDNNS